MKTSLAIADPQSPSTADAVPREACKVAYLVSRFPKLTETFVLYEMLAVQELGVQIELFPLLGPEHTDTAGDGAAIWRKMLELCRKPAAAGVMHPQAEPWVSRAHYQAFMSRAILKAQLYFLWRNPRAYLNALSGLLRGSWGSQNYFVGGLAIFPKTVYFARRMREAGITHVHAHFANHPAAAAFIIHRLTGIPYSFTAHGSDLHRDRHFLQEKVAEARFAVAISQYNRRVILEHCGPMAESRLVTIHCGVDTRLFRPDSRKPIHSSLQILSVGTLHEVKGHPFLVEACRELAHRDVEFVCRIVGDGPDRESLARHIHQAGLGDRVLLLGWRSRNELAELYRRADVVVAPSVPSRNGRREGIPVVLMEAMASGTAVVASDLSGIPELVEHERSGLLVAPKDATGLADALQRLHGSPQRCRQLGRAGRKKVLEEFDLYKNAALLRQRFTSGATS